MIADPHAPGPGAALGRPRIAARGRCTTQFRDTFQEQNGLVTMDRRPKAGSAALARAMRGEEAPAA